MKFRPFPINIFPPTHCPVKRINKTNNKEKTIYISRQLTISKNRGEIWNRTPFLTGFRKKVKTILILCYKEIALLPIVFLSL
jgi:hypothetical protein